MPVLRAEKIYAISNGPKPYQCRWSTNQHFRIFFPYFSENEFSLDFLFLVVVCFLGAAYQPPANLGDPGEGFLPGRCKNADLAGAAGQG
jgi:hypothetical protein